MKTTSSTAAILATLLATTMASPVQKREVSGSVTLFPETNFGGTGYTISFTIDGQGACVEPSLPASIDNQASSVQLSGENAGFYCRLYE
ncbi:hypothetical protein BU24DRAFT_427291 [Aaosphaeria arxii CBS 175.79]|uniref:Uncharacterized protein n=1 Tax=Aaosphaeria arxii CBS 175.79 TaxID=1450172 RepID=A0A6A5XDJ4_9PLEO|nr:uncharacterized protein BU24DRAFT_427291 [Aaosphaeria arxii CBS 175.79]KAF2011082.1 hypothetical protein BU24DRAFT_427291 [Aaosphaeria arxii CBS 175.79]